MSNIGKNLHVELLVVLRQYLNRPASLRGLEQFISTRYWEEYGFLNQLAYLQKRVSYLLALDVKDIAFFQERRVGDSADFTNAIRRQLLANEACSPTVTF